MIFNLKMALIIFKSSNQHIFKSSYLQISTSLNRPIFKSTHPQITLSSNQHIFKSKRYISIQLIKSYACRGLFPILAFLIRCLQQLWIPFQRESLLLAILLFNKQQTISKYYFNFFILLACAECWHKPLLNPPR